MLDFSVKSEVPPLPAPKTNFLTAVAPMIQSGITQQLKNIQNYLQNILTSEKSL